MARLVLVLLVALSVSTNGPAAPLPKVAAPVRTRISAPVTYRDLMLVLVSKEGTAAVTFSSPADDGNSVEYSFRYESADGKTKSSESGKQLFERRQPKGGYDPAGLTIEAGPLKVEWSVGGPQRGWIYYLPEDLSVHLANARDFKELDLRRFMKK
jgi:hypothetical protein